MCPDEEVLAQGNTLEILNRGWKHQQTHCQESLGSVLLAGARSHRVVVDDPGTYFNKYIM